jgi:hypothetical protein
MELLCPNCQQKLTIPDQYAGQLMKCPLCNGTFTAPALPSMQVAPGTPPTPPSKPPSQPPSQRPSAPPAPPPAPAGPSSWEQAHVQPGAPPMAPAAPPEEYQAYAPPADMSAMMGEHRHRLAIWLSPKVLQWFPVGALLIIFILTFFTWVRFGPGGVSQVTQSGWQAAFGSSTLSDEFKEEWKEKAAFEERFKKDGRPSREDEDRLTQKDFEEPGVSVLLIIYLIFLILTVLLVIAVAVLGLLAQQLPLGMQGLMSFRWIIAGGVALLGFLLLALQLLLGFSLENKVMGEVNKQIEKRREQMSKGGEMPAEMRRREERRIEQMRTIVSDGLRRSGWLRTVFWLHLLTVLCAALLFLTDLRRGKPAPRIDILW